MGISIMRIHRLPKPSAHILSQAARPQSLPTAVRPLPRRQQRALSTTPRRPQETSATTTAPPPPPPPPPKKPVGAFRGGILGFLFGVTLAGSAIYYSILDEYRVSNQLLSEDVYNLQAAVQRVESYTRNLESQVSEAQKRGSGKTSAA